MISFSTTRINFNWLVKAIRSRYPHLHLSDINQVFQRFGAQVLYLYMNKVNSFWWWPYSVRAPFKSMVGLPFPENPPDGFRVEVVHRVKRKKNAPQVMMRTVAAEEESMGDILIIDCGSTKCKMMVAHHTEEGGMEICHFPDPSSSYKDGAHNSWEFWIDIRNLRADQSTWDLFTRYSGVSPRTEICRDVSPTHSGLGELINKMVPYVFMSSNDESGMFRVVQPKESMLLGKSLRELGDSRVQLLPRWGSVAEGEVGVVAKLVKLGVLGNPEVFYLIEGQYYLSAYVAWSLYHRWWMTPDYTTPTTLGVLVPNILMEQERTYVDYIMSAMTSRIPGIRNVHVIREGSAEALTMSMFGDQEEPNHGAMVVLVAGGVTLDVNICTMERGELLTLSKFTDILRDAGSRWLTKELFELVHESMLRHHRQRYEAAINIISENTGVTYDEAQTRMQSFLMEKVEDLKIRIETWNGKRIIELCKKHFLEDAVIEDHVMTFTAEICLSHMTVKLPLDLIPYIRSLCASIRTIGDFGYQSIKRHIGESADPTVIGGLAYFGGIFQGAARRIVHSYIEAKLRGDPAVRDHLAPVLNHKEGCFASGALGGIGVIHDLYRRNNHLPREVSDASYRPQEGNFSVSLPRLHEKDLSLRENWYAPHYIMGSSRAISNTNDDCMNRDFRVYGRGGNRQWVRLSDHGTVTVPFTVTENACVLCIMALELGTEQVVTSLDGSHVSTMRWVCVLPWRC